VQSLFYDLFLLGAVDGYGSRNLQNLELATSNWPSTEVAEFLREYDIRHWLDNISTTIFQDLLNEKTYDCYFQQCLSAFKLTFLKERTVDYDEGHVNWILESFDTGLENGKLATFIVFKNPQFFTLEVAAKFFSMPRSSNEAIELLSTMSVDEQQAN